MAKFTNGELEIMKILWDHAEMKPTQIQEKFPRKIKNSALRSYLTILLEKGHVKRRRKGKAYAYSAKTRRETAFRSMYRKMVDAFCGGSTQALLFRLIQEEQLSEEELLELKRLSEGERVKDKDRGGGRK